MKYAEQKGVPPDESAILFCYIGLTSAVARILVGHVCDFKCVKVELITQAAIYINGVAMCILSRADSYSYFLAYSLVYGFCDGLFGSTVNIQVVGSVKPHLTSKAIGFWLAVTSPSIAAGPPIAGRFSKYKGTQVQCFPRLRSLSVRALVTIYRECLFSFSSGKLNFILADNTTKGIAISGRKKNVSLQKKLDACDILTIKSDTRGRGGRRVIYIY